MFEKSLYDLIRGLRNHKGGEREYIQESIRECRKEIRGSDMDLKATALLKLTYLEMFGHDMSWASFHVLEVISSQKFAQKRVGYLAAVQSFRQDTEVLMLAENQLKKDLTSPSLTTISLPLIAVPHVINPSMANSLLSDILPRLTHSSPLIRKKTIVTLYRLALVYPETLRPAWPRIKERLQDENENPSVTAAVVNVICELGWRRPQDFLPLAPRLFDLLVQGGNNWMAIKIIKLFATLTPLEPRLVKKLLPPLTNIIKTTPAMSLLYECIHGIIQGGILASIEGTVEGDEIAKLCVGKLRSMLVIEGDPNLKYVSLLAFESIVSSHPQLVSLHQDVILECIDDPDISIRTRALDLVVGLVSPDNLVSIIARLMRQLRNAPIESALADPENDRGYHGGVVPYADSDDSEAEESLRPAEIRSDQAPPLPEDYRINVIRRIIEMCARDTYANINDFDWYIDVLVQLVRVCPSVKGTTGAMEYTGGGHSLTSDDISYDIGRELRNVAVRVKSVRPEVTEAAQSLVLVDTRDKMFTVSGNGGQGVLEAAAWIVGEYANLATNPQAVMTSLLHPSTINLPNQTLATFIQAVPKVFAHLSGSDSISWTPERKTIVSLLVARVIHFLEPLAMHPDLEVQERAVEYLELMRLSSEAASAQETGDTHGDFADPPLLLTQAIPSLFMGMELNPVAPGAQKRVTPPDQLDLDAPINNSLQSLLRQAEYDSALGSDVEDEVSRAYYEKPSTRPEPVAAADRLEQPKSEYTSYQRSAEEEYLDPDIVARRKAERRERHKDDPFYIPAEGSGTSTPNVLRTNNGEEVDIDSIPIMDLDLSQAGQIRDRSPGPAPPKQKTRRNFEILTDENLGSEDVSSLESARPELVLPRSSAKGKKALLQLDSSGLGSLSLDEDGDHVSKLDIERREQEEAEMAKAIKEVERMRLEMQRANERIEAKHLPPEGTVVKRKKKKPKAKVEGNDTPTVDEGGEAIVVKKKKKAKKPVEGTDALVEGAADGEPDAKPKKKKKRRLISLDEPSGS
ncbi:Adaptor protein complex AP-3 delta subunit [Pseudovirgaria hyperparasitica]|uniref:AP-3 complex subunit delta n=1 Tax=Pseudovirgaria hyperparasitica TaxID=470096 RepID=A0A6A6W4E5_9PEZI|nr:Adaptor protein complex AP-3 delta subunit [Pseudovirgaria hyperparasitica]KAF2757039.1 Adaptor protein complex AP-3 delta subunit [Pseudovirgaria hyperparasitica]